MKKLLTSMVAAGAMLAMCAMPMQAAPVNLNLTLNGEPVHADASMGAPFVTDNNRTMIPLRLVGEMVDCTVDFKAGVVTITNDAFNYSAIFKKGAMNCTINGQTKALDAPMIYKDGRSYVPIRALGESFGKVEWIQATKTVNVETDMVAQGKPVEGQWKYTLSVGTTADTKGALVVSAQNEKNHQVATLSVPKAGVGDYFVPENRGEFYIDGAKVTGNRNTLCIGRSGMMGGAEKHVYAAPSLTNGKNGALEYMGTIPYKTDYAIDNGKIYFTDGTEFGPWGVEPKIIYVAPVGDTAKAEAYKVDFDINRCALTVKNGVVIATDASGVEYEVTLK